MPWRAKAAATVLAAGLLYWGLGVYEQTPVPAQEPDRHPHVLFDRTMAGWRAAGKVPPAGRVGYRDDFSGPNPPPEDVLLAGTFYMMAQYGLTPAVVDRDASCPVTLVRTRAGNLVVERSGATP